MRHHCKTPAEVLQLVTEQDVKCVDIKFSDFPGVWQHFTIPATQISEETFEEGLGFDGSSIRGWKGIQESDMLVVPDPTTALIDPFIDIPTLSLICGVVDPITKELYTRDPRNVAKKAEAYLISSGIGDTAFFGPELEFFILDDARYSTAPGHGYYYIDSVEAKWNSGREENIDESGISHNLGHKPRHKQGYFPVAPNDVFTNLRNEMMMTLIDCGIDIETQHHEVATAGQAEIDMKFDTLVSVADKCMLYKYIVKNTAMLHGHTVTFMPKPVFSDNGSGMHTHQSIWKDDKPTFAGNGYAGLSETALHYIGGLLRHARALCAFTNPTTNSYRRLVPGYEAPVNLAYSQRNRSACCRIPMYSPSPKAKRVEWRCPDPTANPYLAFSAMLMAGLDGIQNKIDPGESLDKNIYDLPPEEAANIKQVPGSLEAALEALDEDHEFLLRGDVFTEDVIKGWIDYKYHEEVMPVRLRPHPHEFEMYYDI